MFSRNKKSGLDKSGFEREFQENKKHIDQLTNEISKIGDEIGGIGDILAQPLDSNISSTSLSLRSSRKNTWSDQQLLAELEEIEREMKEEEGVEKSKNRPAKEDINKDNAINSRPSSESSRLSIDSHLSIDSQISEPNLKYLPQPKSLKSSQPTNSPSCFAGIFRRLLRSSVNRSKT